ncbi:AroM family protein [Escherichia coli]
MSASLAILTIGIVPMQEVLPLLTEYIDEDNISHHSLLGKLSRRSDGGGVRARSRRRHNSHIIK